MENAIHFAPVLYVRDVAAASLFYQAVFNVTEVRRWLNDEGGVHVAELQLHELLFHLHEEVPRSQEVSPHTLGGTPVVLGVFIADPHHAQARAIASGATETHPVQDYEYGYRQGSFTDPFGHHWVVQQKLD